MLSQFAAMIRQTSTISLRQKTHVFLATKTLSSQASTLEPPVPTYIQQRKAYNLELGALRKVWTAEIKLRKEREAARLKAERERIVLRQAVRLRQDRIAALIVQEKEMKKKAADKLRIMQHLARNEVIRVMKRKVQQGRLSRMVQDVHDESRVWITKDNLNQRINDNLFETEATTGLVTRSSQHWRYYALTYQFGPNMLDPDATGNSDDEEDAAASIRAARNAYRLQETEFPADSTSIHRMAELFVQPMINTGAERERFNEIVQQVGDSLQYMDKVQVTSKRGNYQDRMSTNWLGEKSANDWDSDTDEDYDDYETDDEDMVKDEEKYVATKTASPRRSNDKYTIESDESGDEGVDIENLADDSEIEKPKPKPKKGVKIAGKVPKKR